MVSSLHMNLCMLEGKVGRVLCPYSLYSFEFKQVTMQVFGSVIGCPLGEKENQMPNGRKSLTGVN